MPAEGLPWLARDEILSFEEIERLVRLLVGLGIEDVRLTGGEPLVRRDFPRLVSMLAGIDGLRDLSLTTNGYLLDRDARRAGRGGDPARQRLDRLAAARPLLPDHPPRRAAEVLAGLEAIAAHPEVQPIKVNAVAMRDFTEDEVLRFCEFARSTDYQVRFIEFMPLDGDRAWTPDAVLSGAEIRRIIETVHPLEEVPREPHADRRASSAFATGAVRSASSTRCPSRSAPTATGSG